MRSVAGTARSPAPPEAHGIASTSPGRQGAPLRSVRITSLGAPPEPSGTRPGTQGHCPSPPRPGSWDARTLPTALEDPRGVSALLRLAYLPVTCQCLLGSGDALPGSQSGRPRGSKSPSLPLRPSALLSLPSPALTSRTARSGGGGLGRWDAGLRPPRAASGPQPGLPSRAHPGGPWGPVPGKSGEGSREGSCRGSGAVSGAQNKESRVLAKVSRPRGCR